MLSIRALGNVRLLFGVITISCCLATGISGVLTQEAPAQEAPAQEAPAQEGPAQEQQSDQETSEIVVSNLLDQDVQLDLFSEKKQQWLKPVIKLSPTKKESFNVQFNGEHNFKLSIQGKEYLLGTYDLKKIIADNKIDEIAIGIQSSKSADDKKDKESDGDGKSESGKKSGNKKEDKKVDEHTHSTDDHADDHVHDETGKAVDEKTDNKNAGDYEVGEIVETAAGKMKVVEETKTVNITKMRTETRTRTVTVIRGGVPETVPQTYQVQVPFVEQVTQTIKKLVPISGDGGDATSGKFTGRPTLIFKAAGKTVKVNDSFQKK